MMRKSSIKMMSVLIALLLCTGVFAGCGSGSASETDADAAQSQTSVSTEMEDSPATPEDAAVGPVTLKYWTWFPNAEQLKPVVDAFQEKYPDIKIELNVMESKAYQEKLPVALSTGEDIDIVGVQPSAMVGQIQSYLSDLEPLMAKVVGPDWTSKIAKADIDACKTLTQGPLTIFPLFRSGAMIGYYNAKMLKDFGLQVPKTIDEYKAFSDAIRAKDATILPAVFAGKEAWVCDEMMLTVMGQSGDYYNQWRYKGAIVDSEQFINAMNGFKKFFDYGIFTKDVMDLDYGRAYEMFSTGKAATFYQGTWEAGIVAESVRKAKNIALEDVGIFALPTVEANGKATLRSFLDCTVGIVKSSKNQEAAAQWVSYLACGDGVDLWATNFIGSPGKVGFKLDESLLTTQAAKDGYQTMSDLVGTATADRNNVSGYSDIEGASVQKVITGMAKAEDEVKALQKEWSSGKYGK